MNARKFQVISESLPEDLFSDLLKKSNVNGSSQKIIYVCTDLSKVDLVKSLQEKENIYVWLYNFQLPKYKAKLVEQLTKNKVFSNDIQMVNELDFEFLDYYEVKYDEIERKDLSVYKIDKIDRTMHEIYKEVLNGKVIFTKADKLLFNEFPCFQTFVKESEIEAYKCISEIHMEQLRKVLSLDIYNAINAICGVQLGFTPKIELRGNGGANQHYENIVDRDGEYVIDVTGIDFLHSNFANDVVALLKNTSNVNVLYQGQQIYSANSAKSLELATSIREIDVTNELEYNVSIILPIYNNGKFLRNVSFPSVLNLSFFDSAEIILVDDGSTDEYTINTINDLTLQYKNVVSYFFNDGGSGSASRPRNKGVEISRSDYVMYLDPDNKFLSSNMDILFENRFKSKMVSSTYYTISQMSEYCLGINQSGVVSSVDFLKDTSFYTINPQSTIFKKDENFIFISGQFAEDTLYAHQFALDSQEMFFINLPTSVYFSFAEGSVTNRIDMNYVEKYEIVNEKFRDLYSQHGVLEAFLVSRYKAYFFNWITKGYIKSGSVNEQSFAKFADLARIFEGFPEHCADSFEKSLYDAICKNEYDFFIDNLSHFK